MKALAKFFGFVLVVFLLWTIEVRLEAICQYQRAQTLIMLEAYQAQAAPSRPSSSERVAQR